MTIRRLLKTTSNFDDTVTNFSIFILDVLRNETVNSKDHTFYLYQDFSFSETLDESKSLILKAIYSRLDLAGFSENIHRLHFIRSRVYGKMAKERTLAYFNKIIFQT